MADDTQDSKMHVRLLVDYCTVPETKAQTFVNIQSTGPSGETGAITETIETTED